MRKILIFQTQDLIHYLNLMILKRSMETQKIPIFFSQKTKRHQEDEGMFSRRMDYLIDALSKIAKVQSFEKDSASVRRLANHL